MHFDVYLQNEFNNINGSLYITTFAFFEGLLGLFGDMTYRYYYE